MVEWRSKSKKANGKMVMMEYDFLQSLPTEKVVRCLSPVTLGILQSLLEYAQWKTRYYSETESAIDANLIKTWADSASWELMDGCMSNSECFEDLFSITKSTSNTVVSQKIIEGDNINNNNTTIYNNNPAGYLPNVADSDVSTNTAYCYALEAFTRTTVAGILEAVVSANDEQETNIKLGLAMAEALIGIATGGILVPFTTALSFAIVTKVVDYLNDLEEAAIERVLTNDDEIAELVCCAYPVIENQRIDAALLSTLWEFPCADMSDDVLALLPILHDVVGDFDVFLNFLNLSSIFVTYAAQGLIDNDCTLDCAEVWEEIFEFNIDDGGFLPYPFIDVNNTHYVAATAWEHGDNKDSPLVWVRSSDIYVLFPNAANVTYMNVQGNRISSTTDDPNRKSLAILDNSSGSQVLTASRTWNQPDGLLALTWNGSKEFPLGAWIRFQINSSRDGNGNFGGSCDLTRVILRGSGVNPFI